MPETGLEQPFRQVSDILGFRFAVIGWRRLTEREHGVFERVLYVLNARLVRSSTELAQPLRHTSLLEIISDEFLHVYHALLQEPILHRRVALRSTIRARPPETNAADPGI
jgi:hypothetical protein